MRIFKASLRILLHNNWTNEENEDKGKKYKKINPGHRQFCLYHDVVKHGVSVQFF